MASGVIFNATVLETVSTGDECPDAVVLADDDAVDDDAVDDDAVDDDDVVDDVDEEDGDDSVSSLPTPPPFASDFCFRDFFFFCFFLGTSFGVPPPVGDGNSTTLSLSVGGPETTGEVFGGCIVLFAFARALKRALPSEADPRRLISSDASFNHFVTLKSIQYCIKTRKKNE